MYYTYWSLNVYRFLKTLNTAETPLKLFTAFWKSVILMFLQLALPVEDMPM